MKKSIVTLGLALASLLAANAFAQDKGDVDPAQSRAAPTKPATAKEKADARAARIATGKEVAKTSGSTPAEGQPISDARTGIPKAERQAAATKRRAEAAAAVKRKETPSGEK